MKGVNFVAVGGIICLISPFTPMLSSPLHEQANLLTLEAQLAYIASAFAVLALLLAAFNLSRIAMFSGFVNALLVGVVFLQYSEMKEKAEKFAANTEEYGSLAGLLGEVVSNSVVLHWGWPIWLVGSGLIIYGSNKAASEYRKQNPEIYGPGLLSTLRDGIRDVIPFGDKYTHSADEPYVDLRADKNVTQEEPVYCDEDPNFVGLEADGSSAYTDTRSKMVGIGVVILGVVAIGTLVWTTFGRPVSRNQDAFLVTDYTNVRDAPTTEGSQIVGEVLAGERLSGEWLGDGAGPDQEWLKVSEDNVERYVWGGNLRPIYPSDEDDMALASREWTCSFFLVPGFVRGEEVEVAIIDLANLYYGVPKWNQEGGLRQIDSANEDGYIFRRYRASNHPFEVVSVTAPDGRESVFHYGTDSGDPIDCISKDGTKGWFTTEVLDY